ncbi:MULTISPECIES: sensor domain-containing diguanylate cyclase [unclassified Thioalkalivibrio]|uniref:sensor domain-containing diguanylate cyclase n=1 Tax=unclassified Thioalkalivibrio TaxID=2621013 RepID=UPI0003764972|nr:MULTISPECIES: sensor domain-containing diguanylate cyclase [unclassified Thioalkalivibrio]
MATVAYIEGFEKLRLLDAAIDQSSHSVLITDADLDDGPRIVYVNAGFEQMTGYAADEVLGKTPRLLQGPRTSRVILDRLRAALDAGEMFDGEAINYRKDGSTYVVRWHISPVYADDAPERITHYVSLQQDVTAERERDEQLRLLSTALEVSGDPVLITDPEGTITYVNAAFEELMGYSRRDVLGANPRRFRSGSHDDAFYRGMWESLERGETFRGEFVNRRRDGSLIHLEQTITPVLDDHGEISHYVALGKDVTDRVRMEDEIRRVAHTDWLTGVANRLSLGNTLEAEIERSQRYGRPLSLIMFDLDHFKAVNDRYGHDAGDEVLKALAKTVSAELRDADTLGRWGGEEFIILVPETRLVGATAMAEKLRQAVAAMSVPGVPGVTASFGVAERASGDSAKLLARRADEAMYQAKRAGRDRVVAL